MAESDLLSPRLAAVFPTPSVLIVPLVVGARRYGAVFLGFDQPHLFTQEEIALGEQAGALVALAVARLAGDRGGEAPQRHALALRQASLAVTSRLELERRPGIVLEHALQLFSGDDGHIFLYDGERLSFGAARWSEAGQHEPYSAPRADGLTMRVARGGERIVVPSVDEDPLYRDWKWGGAIVGLPLRVGAQVLGVMNLAFHQPRHFADDELDDLQLLADQAALALQNASLFAQADAERQQLSLLVDLGRELASMVEPGAILEQAVRMTTQSSAGDPAAPSSSTRPAGTCASWPAAATTGWRWRAWPSGSMCAWDTAWKAGSQNAARRAAWMTCGPTRAGSSFRGG